MWFMIWGCSPVLIDENKVLECDETVSPDDSNVDDGLAEDSGVEPEDTGEDVESVWSEATLEVLSPQSAEFIFLGEETLFEAAIFDEDGNELEFTEIEWSSSEDSSWIQSGDSFYDTLIAGRHAITAQAKLPNGDRLSYVAGGVLVQHPNAGIYAGTTSIDVTINYSPPITVSCSGGVTVTIDTAGEFGTGQGDCIVNINGADIPSSYLFDLELVEDVVGGTAALDLWLIQQAFPLVGSVGDGELTASWNDSILSGYIDVVGTLDLTRVSLY
jgi:hypothetical protein